MDISSFAETTGWLLAAWAIGWGCGFMYLTFKKISDIIV